MDSVMDLDIDAVQNRLKEICHRDYDGTESDMASRLGETQQTFNRLLNKPQRTGRAISRVIGKLVERGYSRDWLEYGTGPMKLELRPAVRNLRPDGREAPISQTTPSAFIIPPMLKIDKDTLRITAEESPLAFSRDKTPVAFGILPGGIQGIAVHTNVMAPYLRKGEWVACEMYGTFDEETGEPTGGRPFEAIKTDGFYIFSVGQGLTRKFILRQVLIIDEDHLALATKREGDDTTYITPENEDRYTVLVKYKNRLEHLD